MTLLSEFKRDIINCIDSDRLVKNTNLIRRHDKNLARAGDFSFPSWENSKVWGQLSDGSAVENRLKCVTSLVIEKISVKKGTCLLYMDRAATLQKFFMREKVEEDDVVRVEVNCLLDPSRDDLTAGRVKLLAGILGNCLGKLGYTKENQGIYAIGIQPPHQELNLLTKFVQVGPVLNTQGKKSEASLEEYHDKVFSNLEVLDQERCEPDETEEARETRLRILTKAQVQFDMTSTSPAVQTTVSDSVSNTAVFVLYNSARISQIISSFKHNVQEGLYPPLPQQVDWTLLSEEEEWEIFFAYILPYKDVLEEAAVDFKLHRIPLHLIGLSNCLSRYYSRVKILRDPLPKLIPVIHARIQFLKEIKKIILSSLNIMGLENLKKM